MDFTETLICLIKDRFGLHIRVYRKLASASKSHTFPQSRFSFRGRAYCQVAAVHKIQTNF
jgi:predicted alpha/beta hydrolase